MKSPVQKTRADRPTVPDLATTLEAILNQSPAFVFRWRMAEDWPVEYVSSNVHRLGYTTEDFLTGAVSWSSIVHPDDVPRLEREMAAYLAEGRDLFSNEYRLYTRGGEIRWMRDWNVVIRDGSGEITHIQGLILDVTAEHDAAAETAHLQHRLRREVLSIATRERTRIGRELTEGIAQTLVGVHLGFDAVERALRGRGFAEADRVRALGRLLREAVMQVRIVADSLMPVDFDQEGLAAALTRLTTDLSAGTRVRCRCDVNDAGLVIDHGVAVELFEIGRTALAAAVRDSHPTDASIRLAVDGPAGWITIETFGGIPPPSGLDEETYGLLWYRVESLGGALRIERTSGGLRIECGFVNAGASPREPPAP